MEFLTLLVIVAIVFFFAWLNSSNTSQPTTAEQATPGPRPSSRVAESYEFRVSARRESITLDDGQQISCFKVSVMGLVVCSYPVRRTHRLIEMVEVARDGEEFPVLCAIEELQAPNTPFFMFLTSKADTLPYEQTLIEKWMPCMAVPVESLTFPHKGAIQIKFKVQILHEPSGTVLASGETTMLHANSGRGYIDDLENRLKADRYIVQLGVLLCMADGERTESEAAVVRRWIAKKVGGLGDPERSGAHKRELNQAVQEVFGVADPQRREWILADLADKIVELLDTSERYQVLELLLDIAQADGKGAAAELDMLHQIAEWLELDFDRFRAMRDKALPVSIYENGSAQGATMDMQLLGLTDSMTPEEVRAHLNKEYRKWNNRANTGDPKVREQAQQMLAKIAEYRGKIVGKS